MDFHSIQPPADLYFGFFVAIIIAVLTFIIPFKFSEFNNIKLLKWYLISLSIRQIIVLLSSFGITTMASGGDAKYFHYKASLIASKEITDLSYNTTHYEVALGYIYELFGASIVLGGQLSILCFSFSSIFFIKIMNKLNITENQVIPFVAFSMFPSSILFGSALLREPYQLLLIMLFSYYALHYVTCKGAGVYYLSMAALISFLMIFIHKAFIIISLFHFVLIMLWGSYKNNISKKLNLLYFNKKTLLLLVVAPFFVIVLPNYLNIFSGVISFIGVDSAMKLFEMAESNQAITSRVVARANYAPIVLSSPSTILFSYLNYLFAPMPWESWSIADFIASFESLSRIVFMYYIVRNLSNIPRENRNMALLLLVMYFAVTFMFAMGTTNYGTAIRHKTVSWWIIALIGGSLMSSKSPWSSPDFTDTYKKTDNCQGGVQS